MTRSFLETDADLSSRKQALVANMRQTMIAAAREGGGEVHRDRGVIWTLAAGDRDDSSILFPRLPARRAGERLDAIVAHYRQHRPRRSVGCWSLLPSQPADLGVRLLARGFERGWRPHWMWLDFRALPGERPAPHGLTVEIVDGSPQWDVEDLPYFRREPSEAAGAARPRGAPRRWHFAASWQGRVVGHCTLRLTTGRLGVAGLFGVGVVPAARRRGVGTALTLAACRFAERLGCRHAALNATPEGEHLYRSLGFVSMGYGQTWWLHPDVLAAPAPTPGQVAFAEAIGRGDVAALETLERELPEAPRLPLANGMRPLQLAALTRRGTSAEWLLAHGAEPDVLAAWELGWRERVAQWLARDPALANRRGHRDRTPLHEAVDRDDVELARLLLASDADLSSEDGVYQSTPLGWARHLGRREIAALIERHQARAGV